MNVQLRSLLAVMLFPILSMTAPTAKAGALQSRQDTGDPGICQVSVTYSNNYIAGGDPSSGAGKFRRRYQLIHLLLNLV